MAFEVNFPVALLPTGQGPIVTEPVAEQDVPLDRKQKPKKVSKKQDRAYSGTPLWVSNGRSPQPIKGLPVQKAWPGEGTGVTYKGPFVPEEGVSIETNSDTKNNNGLFKIPERQYYIEPGKDTLVSKTLRPDEDELEAARNGMRWHWALEHRFMPPGSQWNQTVWQGADRENQWLARMLQQTAAEKGGMMSPIAQVRLRGQWLSERNKAIQDYINGNWDDPDRAYKAFQSAIDKIDTKLRELGVDEALLRPVPPVAGKRSQFTAQAGPSKLRKQWNYANTVNNKLNEWLTTESKPGVKKINDPEFMGKSEVTTYLDSVYETLIKYLKESSNAMADAEKKRLQILTLTDEGHDAVVQTIKAYQRALAGVMSSASAKDWSQNNRGKVNEVIEAMGFDPDQMDKATLGQQMAALGGVIVSSLSKNDELPHDVRTDLEAIQEQYDKYMENMMFAANVAPHIVASMASALGETAGNQYNDQAFVAGRQLADNLGEIKNLTDTIPRNAVPMSRLLDPPQFIVPSLAKKPKGKAGTNPESAGENAPRPAGTGTNGVIQADGSIDY